MEIFYTDTADVQRLGEELLGSDDLQARIVWAKGRYVLDATETNADFVRIAQLPVGATVVPGLSFIDTEACGTTFSVTVGDSADPDRYSGTLALATAGNKPFAGGVAAHTPFVVTEATTWVQLDITTVSTLTSGAKFTAWIAYILP